MEQTGFWFMHAGTVSYPSFAKPIDTSHRVVCHGTLSAGKQAERGQGEVNYTEMLSSNILSDLWHFQMAE